MKKLFSMVLAFLLLFSLAACTEEATPEVDTITIEIVYEEATTTGKIEFDNKPLLELIDESDIEIFYQTSEYGSFVTGIERLLSQAGNYIQISVNGEPSMVGIDDIELAVDDVITFELVWWDQTAQAVNVAIQEFLENHASEYVNENLIDYNVLSALNLLGLVEDFILQEEVTSLYQDVELTTVTDYFKAITIYEIVGIDTGTLISELNNIYTPGPYGQTAFGILALSNGNADSNWITKQAEAVTYFNQNTPYDSGLDTGGIGMVALSMLVESNDPLITDFANWIAADQLETGGIKTRDSVYGDVTYPGTENASSIAQVVLGLLANGIDPAGATYTIEGNNLITRLLDFKTETGSYSWLIDGQEDLMFSTPQVFLALVCYQEYINTYMAVNPYTN